MQRCLVTISLLSVLCGSFLSCKKEEQGSIEEITSPTTGTRMEFTLDSIFLYAKQVYLWSEVLPSYDEFNPRTRYGTVSPELTAYKSELYDISQMNTNPQTGSSYELPVYAGNPKYSYLEQGNTNNAMATMAAVSNTSSEAICRYEIIEIDNKKSGYLFLATFPALTTIKEKLDAIFISFSAAKITNIIVDLRYNGGGYVETAEYVANLIAPGSLTSKVMYSEQFNSLMQNGKTTILKNQLYLDANGNTVTYQGRLATMADVDYSKSANTIFFNKAGNLATIQTVYFIVSGNTASASELLISSLKPYLDVQLVGQKTYGKPVGFFGIHIDRYTVYLSSFILQNAAGWHDYFGGMQPDVEVLLSSEAILGDLEEKGLYTVLSLIKGTAPLGHSLNKERLMSNNKHRKTNENMLATYKALPHAYRPIYKRQFRLK